jgi:hypothetical protein
MTSNDHVYGQSDKSTVVRIRKISLDADAWYRHEGRAIHEEQFPLEATARSPGLDLGLGHVCRLLRPRNREAVMNSRNATIQVYDEPGLDVVPPFLVGEVAGSLLIDEDREQLRQFAESILEWLERTERRGGATIYRLASSDA